MTVTEQLRERKEKEEREDVKSPKKKNKIAYRQCMGEYRARWDAYKKVQDLMKTKRLLISGEEKLTKAMYWHTEHFNFPESPSGIAENRFPTSDDAISGFKTVVY